MVCNAQESLKPHITPLNTKPKQRSGVKYELKHIDFQTDKRDFQVRQPPPTFAQKKENLLLTIILELRRHFKRVSLG